MQKYSSSLDPLFRPRTVAVIGAKDTPNTVGRTVMVNLTSSGFKGSVIPVNPNRSEVLGIPCFKSVVDAPKPVDMAVIVVPAAHVPGVMRTCAEAGVKGVIIISAGFAELGEAGKKLEDEVIGIARERSIRVIGPNCLGLMNPSIGLNATFARGIAAEGKLAFLSQSGALCTAVLDWSKKENIGFSSFVSVGSMCDVGWGDLIEYFGEDPSTKGILMYIEAVHDPRSFLSAAREVSWRKPIIVIKPGRTKEGAHAAASHTGALVGSDEVFDAACDRAGILRVDRVSQLFHMAEVLAHQPAPAGPHLAIVTNAGGPAVLTTDALIADQGELAELSDGTLRYLDTVLPAAWSHGNPVDVLGDASPEKFKEAVSAVLNDSGTDGAIVILTPQDMSNPTATAQAIGESSTLHKKPVIASWMGGETVEEGRKILSSYGIPSFPYPDSAAEIFALLCKYLKKLHELFLPPRARAEKSLKEMTERRNKTKELFSKWADADGLLSERISKQVLSLYGLPVVLPEYAGTEEEACAIAQKIGFPVVVKVEAEGITHKTDINGVFLNLKNETAVKEAFRTIQESVKSRYGEEIKTGVTVQKMIVPSGVELIVGSKRDGQFGQVILFGAGGVNVEIFGDMALGLPPLTSTLAGRMIRATKIAKALKNPRKGAPVPFETVEDFLMLFSDVIIENPEIAECDINPVLATSSGLFCLDARIVVNEKNLVDNATPSYPREYVREVRGNNGKPLRIRPVRPEDASFVKLFHERLSNTPYYHDVFAFLPFQNLPLEVLLHLCHMEGWTVLVAGCVDEQRVIGLAAMRKGRKTSELFLYHEPDERVGELLIANIREIGKKEGVEKIFIRANASNRSLTALLSSHGFIEAAKKDDVLIFECS